MLSVLSFVLFIEFDLPYISKLSKLISLPESNILIRDESEPSLRFVLKVLV